MLLVIGLGLVAGVITTVAGMGGGLCLLLGLSVAMDPLTALTVTGPGLLVGNVHRLWLYRRSVNRPLALRYAVGAMPAALVGGLVAVALPDTVIRVAMVALASLATAKVLLGWRWKPPASALVPGGAVVGFVSGTSGGGGLIAGPMLLATGLSGKPYVATAAVGAASVHVGRMVGYGAGGVIDSRVLILGFVAAVAISAGNLVGDRIRRFVPEPVVPKLEIGVVVLAMGLALAGIA